VGGIPVQKESLEEQRPVPVDGKENEDSGHILVEIIIFIKSLPKSAPVRSKPDQRRILADEPWKFQSDWRDKDRENGLGRPGTAAVLWVCWYFGAGRSGKDLVRNCSIQQFCSVLASPY